MADRDPMQKRLARLASAPGGVVGRGELIAAGFTPAGIDHAVRVGRLTLVFRGVYAVGREVESIEGLWRAAVITAGPGAALMGRTAAQAWGMLERPSGLPRLVEVARPARRLLTTTLMDGLPRTRLIIRQRSLDDADVNHINGVPLTSPAATFVEMAARLRRPALRRLFFEACRLGRLRRDDLGYCLAASRGRPGAALVRETVATWIPGMERIRSPLEGMFLAGWTGADPRIPEVNAPLGRWTVDFLWRAEKVVVETDGRAFHSHETAQRRDRRKDEWLRSQGFIVLRFTYGEVEDDLGRVLATVKTTLAGPTAD